MIRKTLSAVLFFLATLPLTSFSADLNMNPGKWEMTFQTEMAGMPGMPAMPPMTVTQCLENEPYMPQNQDPSQECKTLDFRQEGNTVFWKMVCTGEGGTMEGSGQMTYSGDTMSGVMNMIMKDQGLTIKNTISGRRLGPCD